MFSGVTCGGLRLRPHAHLGQLARERHVLHRRCFQQAQQQRIAGHSGKAVFAEQVDDAEPLRPGRRGLAQRLAERRPKRDQRAEDAGELVEQLRHQRERVRILRRSLISLALGLQNAAEIVAGLGMRRLKLQQALIGAGGGVELTFALVLERLCE